VMRLLEDMLTLNVSVVVQCCCYKTDRHRRAGGTLDVQAISAMVLSRVTRSLLAVSPMRCCQHVMMLADK
jgi:hypothetical protein